MVATACSPELQTRPDASSHVSRSPPDDRRQPDDPDQSAGACLDAPALPPLRSSDPGKRVVTIDSEATLQRAMARLRPDTVLLLEPGQYHLTRSLYIQQDDVTIRGNSDSCDAVELIGLGMENADGADSVPFGVWIDRANIRIQNLAIRDVYRHAVTINAGGVAPEIYNVRMRDAGEQFVKANPHGFGQGVPSGRVEYSIMEYTRSPPLTDHGGGTGYTNGVDVHGGRDWVIRHNLFRRLHTPDHTDHLNNPAILMWNGSSNTVVENNRFIDVDRAIAFGLIDRANDHRGGIVRNNMIVMTPGLYSDARSAQSDAPIIVWSSPDTTIVHNTRCSPEAT